MKKKSFIKNIIGVAFSNCISILSGIVVGFFIPKILSVIDYGYYKTFTLYMTYVGFFSLGIIDGIVLHYGGNDYSSLNKKVFRSYFKWYIAVHLFFASCIIFLSGFGNSIDNKFIVSMIGINMVALNIIGYFQQISQITQRFKEYSMRKIIQSICNIITTFILLLVAFNGIDVKYNHYIFIIVLINILMSLWYVYTYKEIVFGGTYKMLFTKKRIKYLIKIGFPLLVANLCTTSILSLDRQFVNLLFDTTTYAIYAFAYNMLALVTVATSAISTVIYPALKRTSDEELRDNYSLTVSGVLVGVYAAIALYFPLCGFIKWFLPNYTDSLVIFRIIFPGLAFSTVITVVMHNYYKVLGQSFIYFKKSVIILALSAIANGMAYAIFRTTASISAASIIIMVIWYLYVEDYLIKNYRYSRENNFIYLVCMMLVFYFIGCIDNLWVGFLVYILVFGVISLCFFWNKARRMYKLIK